MHAFVDFVKTWFCTTLASVPKVPLGMPGGGGAKNWANIEVQATLRNFLLFNVLVQLGLSLTQGSSR